LQKIFKNQLKKPDLIKSITTSDTIYEEDSFYHEESIISSKKSRLSKS